MRRDFSFKRERRAGRGTLLLATVVIVLCVGVDYLSGGTLRALGHTLASGVWAISGHVRSAVFDSGYFLSHRTLAKKNSALQEELDSYREDAAAYMALKQENEELRALLSVAQKEEGITAPIVSSSLASPYGTFLVGAGAADGIEAGDLVLNETGFVIGVITDVDTRRSVVKETFAAGAEVEVILGQSAARAEGRGGGNAKLILPRDVAVGIGTAVTAPSLDGRPVGIVGSIASSSSSADQTVYLHLPTNLSTQRFVFIAL